MVYFAHATKLNQIMIALQLYFMNKKDSLKINVAAWQIATTKPSASKILIKCAERSNVVQAVKREKNEVNNDAIDDTYTFLNVMKQVQNNKKRVDAGGNDKSYLEMCMK